MWDASFALAHDPSKCKRFGEGIMRPKAASRSVLYAEGRSSYRQAQI